MDNIRHPSFYKYFVCFVLFATPSKGTSFDSIDLSKLDVYFHEGFSPDWVTLIPLNNTSWQRIPGDPEGRRSLSIRNLKLENKPKHTFLSLNPSPAESFTFIFPILMDSSQSFTTKGVGLGLVGIAYNWQIYFNGHLLDDQIFGIKDGKLIDPKRKKRYFISIPNQYLKFGLNQLTIHIVGSRDFMGTGLYYSNPYIISSMSELNNQPLPIHQYGLVWIYLGAGLFWLYMFLKLPTQYNYLYFTGWAFTIAGYNLSRIDFLTPLKNWGLFSFRFEYICIFLSSLFFIGFIQTLIYKKLSKPAIILMIYYGFSAILSAFSPISFINDLLRLWQMTILIPMGLLVYQIGYAVKDEISKMKPGELSFAFFYQSMMGSLLLGAILLFFFLGLDIVSSLFYFNFNHLNIIGFLFFTATITLVAFSDFIQHHIKTKSRQEKLEVEVIRRTKSIQSLAKELIRTQENERARLSRELHDEIGQALTVINLSLQHLAQNTELSSSKKIMNQIRACQSTVKEAADTIHQFAFNLHPSILDDLGLVPAMKSHAKSFSDRSRLQINIDASHLEIDHNEARISLYRIFQESLTNTAKHSDADTINISIQSNESEIQLTIQDNGKGVQSLEKINDQNSGLGIIGMRERIEGLGGSFSFESIPGEGVLITAKLPLQELSN